MATAPATFHRPTFSTSRLLEYFTERELVQQISVKAEKWPLALTKELIDNALDACETGSERPPVITVTLDGGGVSVADNGPGLPEDTLNRSLDYTTRTSDKAHYVSPTRGQLGNALKCLWAAPFVYSGLCGREEHGSIEVATPLYAYRIDVSVDKIAQKPKLSLIPLEGQFVKTGTIIKTGWPTQSSYIPAESHDPYNEDEDEQPPVVLTLADQVLGLLRDYATFNPHASFYLCQDGQTIEVGSAIRAGWEKWLTSSPTTPHWYNAKDLRDLIAAYITGGEGDKTVRDLVSDFRGLSGTAKQKKVVAAADLTGKRLNDMITEGNIDLVKIENLLKAMCAASQPVKAAKMGLIGEEALTKRLIEIDGVVPETVRYVKKASDDEVARPKLVEVAFGIRDEAKSQTRFRFGLNFSPALNIPIRNLPAWLQYDALIEPNDAACLTVHAVCPRFEFTSRAKAMLA